jgi:hypothetical protein
MPRNTTSPQQVAWNRDQLMRKLLSPLYALDEAVGFDPANNPQYGGYKPESQMSPLERRKYYMSGVEGPVRNMDMDAPTPGLTTGAPLQPAKDELPALTPLEERAYQSEASRLQQQAASDPYFQQNELYRKAKEQLNLEGEAGADNRKAVEELGLAIHAAKYGDPGLKTPNPLMAGMPVGLTPRTETGQTEGGAVVTRSQEARTQAMDLAADTVNQLLNPAQNKDVNASMFTPSQSQAVRGQSGFNTSATFDLDTIRPLVTDMQPNLNKFAANRSGQEGFAFDKNILDEKTRSQFLRIAGMYN